MCPLTCRLTLLMCHCTPLQTLWCALWPVIVRPYVCCIGLRHVAAHPFCAWAALPSSFGVRVRAHVLVSVLVRVHVLVLVRVHVLVLVRVCVLVRARVCVLVRARARMLVKVRARVCGMLVKVRECVHMHVHIGEGEACAVVRASGCMLGWGYIDIYTTSCTVVYRLYRIKYCIWVIFSSCDQLWPVVTNNNFWATATAQKNSGLQLQLNLKTLELLRV